MRVAAATRAGGDPATAVVLYRRAHTLEPFNAEPLAKLGGALNDLAVPDEAAQAFRKALGIDPRNTEGLRGLGAALIALDQPELAVEQFEAALAIEDDHRSYSGLGVALDAMGDHALAQAYYRVGLELAPGNLTLLNNLGLSLALTGDHPAAIEALSQAATHPAATARQRQNLALAHGLAGDPEVAARIARLDLDEAAVQSNLAYYDVLRAANDSAMSAAAVSPASVGAQSEDPPPEPAPSRAFKTGKLGWEFAPPAPARGGNELIRDSGQRGGGVQPPPASAEAGEPGPGSGPDEAGGALLDPGPGRDAGETAVDAGRPALTVAGGREQGGPASPETAALVPPPRKAVREHVPARRAHSVFGARNRRAGARLEPAEGGDAARDGGSDISAFFDLVNPLRHIARLTRGLARASAPDADLSASQAHDSPARARDSPAPLRPAVASQIIHYWSGELGGAPTTVSPSSRQARQRP
jgi:Flp pilus assembly protein TadD